VIGEQVVCPDDGGGACFILPVAAGLEEVAEAE
jgi:hypothetical protein